MTPAEQKARELVEKFDKLDEVEPYEPFLTKFCHNSKQCALILCDEMNTELTCQFGVTAVVYGREQFWEEVKTAIENL